MLRASLHTPHTHDARQAPRCARQAPRCARQAPTRRDARALQPAASQRTRRRRRKAPTRDSVRRLTAPQNDGWRQYLHSLLALARKRPRTTKLSTSCSSLAERPLRRQPNSTPEDMSERSGTRTRRATASSHTPSALVTHSRPWSLVGRCGLLMSTGTRQSRVGGRADSLRDLSRVTTRLHPHCRKSHAAGSAARRVTTDSARALRHATATHTPPQQAPHANASHTHRLSPSPRPLSRAQRRPRRRQRAQPQRQLRDAPSPPPPQPTTSRRLGVRFDERSGERTLSATTMFSTASRAPPPPRVWRGRRPRTPL